MMAFIRDGLLALPHLDLCNFSCGRVLYDLSLHSHTMILGYKQLYKPIFYA